VFISFSTFRKSGAKPPVNIIIYPLLEKVEQNLRIKMEQNLRRKGGGAKS